MTSSTTKRRIIGLAGPMAAGKNAAADILIRRGFVVLDGDKIGHQALECAKAQILERFSSEASQKNIQLLAADGSINRRELARIVFADKKNLASHEAIIHPLINLIIEDRLNSEKDIDFVINAALLYKIPVIRRCSCVLYIDAPLYLRFKRVRQRDKLPIIDIIKRFCAQDKIFTKCKKLNADIYRVWNTDTQKKLEQNIDRALINCLYRG